MVYTNGIISDIYAKRFYYQLKRMCFASKKIKNAYA